MTELYALTRTAKENLVTQIENKTAETRAKFPMKENLESYTTTIQQSYLTLTQEDIDYMLDDVNNYFTETKVFHNDTVAIIVGPQYTSLNLPDTIEFVYLGSKQTSILSESFSNMTHLKTVIGKNINNIGMYAFYNSSIERFCVTRPRGETFVLNDCAFEGCTKLHTCELDVDLSYIPLRCFCNCRSLRSFTIYRPELLNKMYYKCFGDCAELEYIINIDKVKFNAMENGCFLNSGLVYLAIDGNFNITTQSNGPLLRSMYNLKELYVNLSEIHNHLTETTPNLEYFRVGESGNFLSEGIIMSHNLNNLIWLECNYPNLRSENDSYNPDFCDFEGLRMISIRNDGYTVVPTYSFKYNRLLTTLYIPSHVTKINSNAINNNDNLEFVVCHAGINLDNTNLFGVVKKRILVMPINGNSYTFINTLRTQYGEDKVKEITMYVL